MYHFQIIGNQEVPWPSATKHRRLDPLNITWENDTFVPPPFVNTHYIEKMHAAPRFGHPNNISLLTSPQSTTDDAINYAIGAFICSILIFAFFTTWAIVLVVLRILGRQRAGFFSGSMNPVPPMPPPAGEVASTESCGNDKEDKGSSFSLLTSKGSVGARNAVNELPKEEDLVQPEPALIDEGKTLDPEESRQSLSSLNDTANSAGMNGMRREDEERGPTSRSPLDEEAVEARLLTFSSLATGSLPPCDENFKGPNNCAPPQQEHSEEDTAVSIYFDAEEMNESTERFESAFSSNCGAATGEQNFPSGAGSVDTEIAEERLQKPTDSADLVCEKQKMMYERCVRRTRIAVLLCGVVIFVCSALMMKKGFQSLVRSLNFIGESLDQGARVISRAINISDEFLLAHNSTKIAIDSFLEITPEKWCPNAPEDVQSQIEAIENEMQKVIVMLKPLVNQITETVYGIRNDLDEFLNMYETLGQYVNQFSWASYVAAAFVVLLDLLVLTTMIAVVLAWVKHRPKELVLKTYRCMHSIFFYSIFLVTLFLLWLFTTIFILGSIVSADFCYNSPDPHVANILEAVGLERFSTFTYEMLLFYISSCDKSMHPVEVDQHLMFVIDALDTVHTFLGAVARIPLEELIKYCGEQSSGLVLLAHVIDAQFHTYINALISLRELFFCENMWPIYGGIAHNALCYSGVEGLTWLYTTQFAVAICCMTIVTLRVAWNDGNKYSKQGAAEENQPSASSTFDT